MYTTNGDSVLCVEWLLHNIPNQISVQHPHYIKKWQKFTEKTIMIVILIGAILNAIHYIINPSVEPAPFQPQTNQNTPNTLPTVIITAATQTINTGNNAGHNAINKEIYRNFQLEKYTKCAVEHAANEPDPVSIIYCFSCIFLATPPLSTSTPTPTSAPTPTPTSAPTPTPTSNTNNNNAHRQRVPLTLHQQNRGRKQIKSNKARYDD